MALGFAYAQARLQARCADLPGETEWLRLAGARSLGAYLEDARAGPLRPWVKGFSALSGAHDLERGIRSLVWEQVHEVASWVPRPWRPAVQWVAWLPFLMVLEQVARGGPLPPWARQDPRLRGLLDDSRVPSPLALQQRGLSRLAAPGDAATVTARWMREWQARWPGQARRPRHPLRSFCRELDRHLETFQQAGPDTAWALRHQLRERLRLRLHQHLLEPLAVFLYLALILLDLERLRGELVRRCLFSTDATGKGAT